MKGIRTRVKAWWKRSIGGVVWCGECTRDLWNRYTGTERFFLILGGIALFVLLTSMFTPLGEADFDTSATTAAPLGSPEYFDAIEGITQAPMERAGTFEVLDDGDDFFPDLMEEIAGAERSVTITNYIWDDGEVSDALFTVLVAKAKAGVKVRVLLDGLGGIGAPEARIEELELAGGKVALFRPLKFGKFTRSHRRTHIRAIAIDGRVAYTGGVAISDAWLGDGTTEGHWRDLMFKTDGAAAESIQRVFAALWRESTGEILAGADFYAFEGTIEGDSQILPNVEPGTTANATTTPRFAHLFHTPSPDLNQSLSQVIWLTVLGAQDSIYIETPYLLPDRNLLEALTAKARAGVKVEIVLPGTTDSYLVKSAMHTYYGRLLEAGVRIYEYQPALLHTKVLVADGRLSLIGSANLDSRSNIINLENLMIVDDPDLAAQIIERFETDKARSTEIDASSWKVGMLGNLIGNISKIFVKQY